MSHGLKRASNGAGTAATSTSTGVAVVANDNRRSIILSNCSTTAAEVVFLAFGVPAVLNAGLRLAAGEKTPVITDWAGDINAISASGTPVLAFIEV